MERCTMTPRHTLKYRVASN